MKWIRGLCAWLTIGSLVGGGVYLAVAEQVEQKPAVIVIIVLAALSWLFIAIGIGGKKGLLFVIRNLVFVACIFLVFQILRWLSGFRDWPDVKRYLNTLADKPGEIALICVGFFVLIIPLILVPPFLITRLVGKLIDRRTAQPQTQAQSAARGPASVVSGWSRRRSESDVGDTQA